MEKFNKALKHTLKFEGGYVNNKNDSGGETYQGVSRNNWPNWEGWKIIDAVKGGLTVKQINTKLKNNEPLNKAIASFYQLNFWQPFANLGLPQKVQTKLFDMAVNIGVRQTVKYYQRVLGGNLTVDGIIGANTIKNSQEVYNNPELKIINDLIEQQKNHYINWTNRNPYWKQYLSGFLKRANFNGEV